MGYRWDLTVTDLAVRACEPQEALSVLELWLEARSGHATTPDRLEDVQRLLSTAPGSLLVATADGAIVGALIAAWDGWRGNIYRLAVRTEFRRRGVGSALLRAGEEYLRRQGARRVTALVAHEDKVAAAFWQCASYPPDLEIARRVRSL